MTNYCRVPNSADEIPFELARLLPPASIPLRQILSSDMLHRFVAQQPSATLKQFCQQVEAECGIILSTTSMCRILKRFGLTRKG